MRKVEGMLRSAVGRPEVLKAARAWRIMHRWSEIVGESLAERSTPDRYDRGTVWVAVRGSAWAQELRLMKETILERMNTMAGDKLFVEVRFGVRAAKPAPFPAPEPVEESSSEAKPDWREGLSILEIARRRMAERGGPMPDESLPEEPSSESGVRDSEPS